MGVAARVGDDSLLHFGKFTLDRIDNLLYYDGRRVHISKKEFEIMAYISGRRGEIVAKSEICSHIWPDSKAADANLRVHIHTLRRVLSEIEPDLDVIRSIPGKGYLFSTSLGSANISSAVVSHVSASLPHIVLPKVENVVEIIGRDSEIDEITSMLNARRLLTIVGPGGVGKTTTAIAAMNDFGNSADVYVAAVEMSSFRTLDEALSGVANALGVQPTSSSALQAISKRFESQPALLLLDNCDCSIQIATELVEVVYKSCPNVKLLTTSREALRALDEWVYRLPPLSVPEAGERYTVHQALEFSSVRLFLDRAVSDSHLFRLDETNITQVCELCRTLDGLPLAIELAAARLHFLGLSGLLAALSHRFEILTFGRRLARPRHRSLKANLDLSYETLSRDEKRMLCALSIFCGEFRRRSVEAICIAPNDSGAGLLDTLASLVSKSLVVALSGGEEVTYRLLGNTRAYGLERLNESEEYSATADWHAKHIHSLLRETVMRQAATIPGAFASLLDDVKAALDWTLGSKRDLLLGCQLVLASGPLWHVRTLLSEYRYWLSVALKERPLGGSINEYLEGRLTLAYRHATIHAIGSNSDESNLMFFEDPERSELA
jgi:predicted ATPase/DNA-binding winged helix-turn-helix (wHTH) protein